MARTLLVVLLLFASACSGGGNGGDDTATTAEPVPTEDAAPLETVDEPSPTAESTTADEPTADEPTAEPNDDATEDQAAADTPGAGDGTLTIGYVLPQSGPIAYLGPPEIAGLQLAVDDVNAAGGVLGGDLALLPGDEAGDPDLAGQAVDRHIADGADVIVGAGSSAISLAIIDRITGAGLLECSGSNTSATFTDYDDQGRYFRTVPSNVLQGPVLAERVVADGNTTVGVLSRADDYGRSLSDSTKQALQTAGAEVVAEAEYDPAGATFDAEVRQIVDAQPDAVIVIAFEEGARILRGLLEAGYTPDQLYGTDGMPLPDLPGLIDDEDPAILDGFTATGTSSSFSDAFVGRLEQANPDLETTLFAPHTYDCGVVFALAAIAADSDDPAAIAEQVVGVTRDGTECDAVADCIALLEEGEDIDYTGASGPLDFSDIGEPGIAIYDVLGLDTDGQVQTLDTVQATAP